MLSKAVLLQNIGDPVLLYNWLRLYKTVWENEADSLYIYLNIPEWVPSSIVDYTISLVNKVPKIRYVDLSPKSSYKTHGEVMKHLLDVSSEPHVMFVEDDGFIFRKGQVARCFDYLSRGAGLVGGVRRALSMGLHQAIVNRYDLLEENSIYRMGCTWWPNFLFVKRELLDQTDKHFGSKGWPAGIPIENLNYTPTEPQSADTFGWMSMQLWELGVEPSIVDQFHSLSNDLSMKKAGMNLWSKDCHWVHAGSLSFTVGTKETGLFAEPDKFSEHITGYVKEHGTHQKGRGEFARRLAWIRALLQLFPQEEIEKIKNPIERYQVNLEAAEKLVPDTEDMRRNLTCAYVELLK